MRIITLTCPDCGTIVAANELESNQVMKCPGIVCEAVLGFDDLSEDEQDYFLTNRELYHI